MEPLFKISQSYTFEELKIFRKVILGRSIYFFALGLGIMFGVGILAVVLAGFSTQAWFCILFPIFMIIFSELESKSYYKSNKILQDMIDEYEFYEENFIVRNKMTEFKIGYDKIYKIIETKTNFYIMISKNQGYIISKSNCTADAIEFLEGLKNRR